MVRLVKPVEMVDRPVTVTDAETVGGGNRGADPGLGVADRGFHVLALCKARGNG